MRLKKLQEAMFPNDPPSPIGSKGQQSEPETIEQMNARYQQEDYWGQLYGSGTTSLVNPTQFPPPPPSYGFDAYGAWMFDHHVGDAGQGSSRQDEDKTMRMMISSRSPRKTPLRPFLVIDDKGGEIIED